MANTKTKAKKAEAPKSKSNGVAVVTYPDPKEVRDPAKPAAKAATAKQTSAPAAKTTSEEPPTVKEKESDG